MYSLSPHHDLVLDVLGGFVSVGLKLSHKVNFLIEAIQTIVRRRILFLAESKLAQVDINAHWFSTCAF
jgi:hypothetical protein